MANADDVLHIAIKTVEGDAQEFDVKADEPVGAVVDDALKTFKLLPPSEAKYHLAVKNDQGDYEALDDGKAVRDAGLKEGGTVWLGTEQILGGASSEPGRPAAGSGRGC